MSQPTKATVLYRPSRTPITVGESAHVFPINHTSPLVSNRSICHTSLVAWYDEETGTFETDNSIYKLVDKE